MLNKRKLSVIAAAAVWRPQELILREPCAKYWFGPENGLLPGKRLLFCQNE